MTELYFVRHAEPDYSNHDDRTRPLTEKGRADCTLVTDYLSDKDISLVVSSPFRRACDTVGGIARLRGLELTIIDAFQERKVTDGWLEDFFSYAKRQWADFDYKLAGGESLSEVQQRNIAALNELLRAHPNRTIVVGTHGTALSTVIHYYDPSFSYADFEKIAGLMPFIAHFTFEGETCRGIELIDLFDRAREIRAACRF